jgi:REP element-mobilizing transposase RayT
VTVVTLEKQLPKRKSTKLKGFDYNTEGAYFVTICTADKQKILSRIVGGDVLDAPKNELSRCGKIADKYINQLNEFYDNVTVDGYVIMPNHIHIMLFVHDNGASGMSPPTSTPQHSAVSRFVSTFKRFCNKEYGENIWQRYFNDHIIRNQDDYDKHMGYICENVIRWKSDKLYVE